MPGSVGGNQTRDTWVTSEPDTDVDRRILDAQIAYLMSQPDSLGDTLAIVAVHRGRVVAEAYAPDIDSDTTLISWSMAKSITHALIGMAVGDGLLDVSAPTKLSEWAHDDRCRITMQHLLEMRSGLSWIEDYVDDTSSDVIAMLFGSGSTDNAGFAIAKSLEHEPGSQWSYSSGTTNIVTRLLARALGEEFGNTERVSNFLQQRLFDVLAMNSATARFDPSGTFVGSSYVFASARDFAKFGYLYLNDGMFGYERVLPVGWVDHGARFSAYDPENGFCYGSHWWTWPSEPDSMVALGYEGQYTWVIPRRELVLVRLGKTDASKKDALTQHLLSVIGAFPIKTSIVGKSSSRV
ncbi:MAG: class C beta-lactamase-related serine hydrolase [Ilumatobacteraceae bacterium]|nr:class C beta-lactamase-related serine hydrolase [Ilumatobacteraceae bacterium]